MDCEITVTENVYVHPLFKECININRPTMYLIGLCFRVCPLLLADVQIRFCLAFLNGKKKLPTKEEMLSIAKEDTQKRWDKYDKIKFSHILGPFQEEYYNDLATIGGIEPIKPHVLKIYNQDNAYKMENYNNFRNQTFRILTDKTYTSGFYSSKANSTNAGQAKS